MKRTKVSLVGLDGQRVPDWVVAELAQAGIDLTIHECVTDEDLKRYAGDAEIVWMFGGSRVVKAHNLALLPHCAAIVRTGSGTDNVPVEAATERGIVVANTPDATTNAVSDHVIGLLFAALRRIAVQDRAVRGGVWDRYRAWPTGPLHGRTLGLIGFGRIAQRVARKLSGFEMPVLTYDPFLDAEAAAKQGAQPAALDEVLARADVVSIHCPLTPQTRNLIDERALRRMKPTAVLINTARGPIIDEQALVRALSGKWIAGAGLDVLEKEPPDPANPLLQMDNVVLTPHIAAYSDEYLESSWRYSVEAVIALADGRWPRSCVNRSVKPRQQLV